jgi:predicted AAA+ superfamily ATPase
MVRRQFWIERIQQAWQRRSVLWLAGVRRVGKTVLSQSVPEVEYFDCELPRVRASMEDPQAFLAGLKGRRVVLDEIHRLGNPSELLKIAADYYPKTKIIATGSSTLGASAKFKDTLAGRKTELWLTPLMSHDLQDFKQQDLKHRFLHGGVPPFFLSSEFPERDIQEWMDAYWSKDIQELFRLERRHSFQKFVELLMAQSGGIFEATNFARPCEVNRTTISNYLKVLELTFVAIVVRPFSTRRSTEIIAAPKVYGFDTGFVCYFRGWHELRRQDMGVLWEHYVLNELQAQLQLRDVYYWRDKRGHEIDFVVAKRGKPPIAIECKWSTKDFDSTNVLAFARQYPKAKAYIVVQDVDRSFTKKADDVTLQFVNLDTLIDALQ